MKKISIAAISHGPNRLDVLGLGTDNRMYHNWYESVNKLQGGWGGWEGLGDGVFSSPPAVLAREDLLLDIYGVGADNRMYHRRTHTHSQFPKTPPVISGPKAGGPTPPIPAVSDTWEAIGGVLSSPLAAVSWG